MKKIIAIVLSLALAFPAASVLAQQAPAPAKQPIQVAQGGAPAPGLFGLGWPGTVLVVALAAAAVFAIADNSDDDNVATGTR